jgi:serine/threonine protein kinase
MDKFDGRVNIWTPDSQCVVNDRFDLYKKLINFDTYCKINIEKRIGSESTMAQVFKVEANNFYVAVKVLPIINEKSHPNNLKEILFAKMASDLVIARESIYFPLVYSYSSCKETYFYGNDTSDINKFYSKSKTFQQYDFLLKSTNDSSIRNEIIRLKRKLLSNEYIKEKLLPKVQLPEFISSDILLSEIASCDLDYYLETNNLNYEEYRELLKNIFLGIKDLHTKLKIVHNDLHLGNILILDLNTVIPLIHDFGKSRESNFEDVYDRQHDIFYFLSRLEHKFSLPKEIEKHLDAVTDIVNSSNSKYPIIQVVDYWNNIVI